VKIRAESFGTAPSDTLNSSRTRFEKSCISSNDVRRNVEQYVQRNQNAIIYGIQKGASNVQVNRTTEFEVSEDDSMVTATAICEEDDEQVWLESCSGFSISNADLNATKNLRANSISCCADVENNHLSLAKSSTQQDLPPYTIDRSQLFPGSVFDTHCHLDFISNRRMRKHSVFSLQDCLDADGLNLGKMFGGCVTNFCDPADWCDVDIKSLRPRSKVFKEALKDKRVFITVGCHPHFADRVTGLVIGQLYSIVKSRTSNSSLVAIGECGLDYSRKNTVDRKVQEKVFSLQLKLAIQFHLPLVLHIRDAEFDALRIMRTVGVPPDWPIHRHCFTGDWPSAASWLNDFPGSKIGVTGIVTYRDSKSVQNMVRNIPLEKLILETDAPYFLPAKLRTTNLWGNCALPGHVIHVAAQVASLKKIELRTVLEHNIMNVYDIYKIRKLGECSNCSDSDSSSSGDEDVEVIRASLE